jgi:chorismate synthase
MLQKLRYNGSPMLRFLTAGESHGPALTVIVEGVPAGLLLTEDQIAADLARRQLGYGRGRRMAIERDRAEILAGVRRGETIGSPIAMLIRNRDWPNWQHTMSVGTEPAVDAGGAKRAPVTRPRPGHADLAGGIRYERDDLRDILERASARETAARVAAGAVARAVLARFGIEVSSHVTRIGAAGIDPAEPVPFDRIRALAADDDVRCVDPSTAAAMRAGIDDAKAKGDTVGGAFEVVAHGVPPGLGTYAQWDRKLDGRLAQALMSIHAIKAVGIGLGPEAGARPGSAVHDEILPAEGNPTGTIPAIRRPTNRAGGLEGGVTNGEDVRVSAWMKPISTLMKPLRSVDLATGQVEEAAIERSDVCAVPAAAVVGEAMVCLVLADALVEHLGGATIAAMEAAHARLTARLATLVPAGPGARQRSAAE